MFDRRLLQNFDWVLFLNTLAIALIGVVAIYSASKGYPGEAKYWLRQLYWIGLGIAAGFLVLLVDMRTLGRWAYVLHAAAILSLVLVLKYGKGSVGSPVERWFVIGGVAFQPAEFVKYTLVLALAYYFRDSRRVGDLGLLRLLWPLAFLAAPFLLIVQQPDLGSAMLLAMVFVPIIVLAGVRLRLLVFLGGLGVAGVPDELIVQARALQGQRYWSAHSLRSQLAGRLRISTDEPSLDVLQEQAFQPLIAYVLRPYQQKRLITFVNPNADPLGAGYHVIQSKVAIGSGKFLGKGFGESTQGALNFLPARHTDFIFAIFAEEWGFLGVLLLLGLYTGLILRGMSIVFQTRDRFSAFLTLGIVSLIALQAMVNAGMAAGLLPVVGVPLPLVSYGGSSMLATLVGIAMLLNIRMRRFLWG
jgi:rod shape determining protein RodA